MAPHIRQNSRDFLIIQEGEGRHGLAGAGNTPQYGFDQLFRFARNDGGSAERRESAGDPLSVRLVAGGTKIAVDPFARQATCPTLPGALCVPVLWNGIRDLRIMHIEQPDDAVVACAGSPQRVPVVVAGGNIYITRRGNAYIPEPAELSLKEDSFRFNCRPSRVQAQDAQAGPFQGGQ